MYEMNNYEKDALVDVEQALKSLSRTEKIAVLERILAVLNLKVSAPDCRDRGRPAHKGNEYCPARDEAYP
jgi:hypothetical protein